MRNHPVYNWVQPTSSFTHDCSIQVASGCCWSKSDSLNSLHTQQSCNLNWDHEKGTFLDIEIHNFYSSSASSQRCWINWRRKERWRKAVGRRLRKTWNDMNPERLLPSVLAVPTNSDLLSSHRDSCNFQAFFFSRNDDHRSLVMHFLKRKVEGMAGCFGIFAVGPGLHWNHMCCDGLHHGRIALERIKGLGVS